MNWTVSRRIITGYAIAMLLLVAIAALAYSELSRSSEAYHSVIREESAVVDLATEAVGMLRTANVEYLRILLEQDPAYGPERENAIAAAREAFAALPLEDPVQAAEWQTVAQLFDRWVAETEASIDVAMSDPQEALVRRRTASATRADVESRAVLLLESLMTRLSLEVTEAESTTRASETAILFGLIVALIVMGLSAYLLNRAVTLPLQETSNVLAASAAEILATTTEQASGATESLAAVTQTAATVDEVVQTAEQAAERARAVAASAQRAAEIGGQGREAVEQSGAAMDRVRTQVDTIGSSILELAEQAQAIGEIITTVNDLAEQTNLLALNAAIEAARAGEQGRGFSVVAGEVRALAEQSKTATVRVRQILGEIQRATSAAVMATEQGNRQVEEGSRQVIEAGETIRQLADASQTSAQAAAQIAASANQQSTGMAQIKQAVGSIQQAAQQNLAATRQAEAAAQELNRLGSRLTGLVGVNGSRGS